MQVHGVKSYVCTQLSTNISGGENSSLPLTNYSIIVHIGVNKLSPPLPAQFQTLFAPIQLYIIIIYTDQQLYGLRLSIVWWFTVTLITLADITDNEGTPQANRLYLTNLEMSTFTGSGRGLRFTLLRNVINISYVITHSQLIMARRRQCIPNARHRQRLSS